MNTSMHLRVASLHDIPVLKTLIHAAVRELSVSDYTEEQIQSALRSIFSVDIQLIIDATYYVVETEGNIIAAGGWSQHQALYASDQAKNSQSQLLNPAHDAARIRAFYVHPQWTRRGIGRQLLLHCEKAARAVGFTHLELMATLTGVPLYTAGGFVAIEHREIALPDGVMFPCVHMVKSLKHHWHATLYAETATDPGAEKAKSNHNQLWGART